jgi:hypothetical protein
VAVFVTFNDGSNPAPPPSLPHLQLQDSGEWDWDAEWLADDEFDTEPALGLNLILLPSLAIDDAWDWDQELALEDEYDTDYLPIANLVLLAALTPDDQWEWESDRAPEDEYETWSLVNVNSPIKPANSYEDDEPHIEGEPEDDFFDHFGNVDALQPICDDAWDWDAAPEEDETSDDYLPNVATVGLDSAPYPRFAYYGIGGSVGQFAPNGGNTAAGISFAATAAYYNLIVAGLYLGAEPLNGYAGATYASVEATWKTNAAANGITLNVAHYVMSQEQSGVGLNGNAATFAWWSAACQSSQFWLYNTYPPGSPVFTGDNGGNTTYQLQLSINQANVCAATVNGFASPLSGDSFWKTFAQYYYDVNVNGLAVSKYQESLGNIAANSGLNAFFLDNYNSNTTVTGAWDQNTTSYPAGNASSNAWLQQGYAKYFAAIKAINPSFLVLVNSNYFENYGSVTLDPSQQGLLDGTICEGFWGTSYGPEARLGPTVAMQNLIAAEAQLNANGVLLVNAYGLSNNGGSPPAAQSSWTTADYQDIRMQAACAMMRRAYYNPNLITTNPNGMIVLAEMLQGGKCGWLGQPASTAQGNPQTAAWYSTVWRRDFKNGTILWNPRGTSAVNINVGSGANQLPSTLSYCVNTGGFGDSSRNTGLPISGTVTLQSGDGLFLIGTP